MNVSKSMVVYPPSLLPLSSSFSPPPSLLPSLLLLSSFLQWSRNVSKSMVVYF